MNSNQDVNISIQSRYFKKDRIILVIQAFKNGQFLSIWAAANTYNILYSTTAYCLCSCTIYINLISNSWKLTSTKKTQTAIILKDKLTKSLKQLFKQV